MAAAEVVDMTRSVVTDAEDMVRPRVEARVDVARGAREDTTVGGMRRVMRELE